MAKKPDIYDLDIDVYELMRRFDADMLRADRRDITKGNADADCPHCADRIAVEELHNAIT